MSKATERALQAKIELAKAKLQEALARAAQINELTAEIDALRAENERLRDIESALRHLLSFDSTIPGVGYTQRCGCGYCKAIESARAALEGER